ncbi:MAG TPA: hypothetical protein VIM47_00945 [Dermatophilaceae bacterium]
MAVAFVRNHTSGVTQTGGTTIAATIATADVAIGNVLVAWMAFDNATTTTPTVSGLSKPGGETNSWARIGAVDSANAGSATGVRGEMWAIKTTVAWAVATAVTATLSQSRASKAILLSEFSGVDVTLRGTVGAGNTTNTTTSPPTASTSGTALVAGDLVLGGAALDFGSSATVTADADTSNGSWAGAAVASTGNNSSSSVTATVQHKIVTATGVQTFNPTFSASSDAGVVVAALVAQVVPVPPRRATIVASQAAQRASRW